MTDKQTNRHLPIIYGPPWWSKKRYVTNSGIQSNGPPRWSKNVTWPTVGSNPTDFLDDPKHCINNTGIQLTSLVIQKSYMTNRGIQLTSLLIQKRYLTNRGIQLTYLVIQKRYMTIGGIQLTSFVIPKRYVTNRGIQLTSLVIQKQYLTNRGIQLTPWWSKNTMWPTGGSNWPFRWLDGVSRSTQVEGVIQQMITNVGTSVTFTWDALIFTKTTMGLKKKIFQQSMP